MRGSDCMDALIVVVFLDLCSWISLSLSLSPALSELLRPFLVFQNLLLCWITYYLLLLTYFCPGITKIMCLFSLCCIQWTPLQAHTKDQVVPKIHRKRFLDPDRRRVRIV